MRVGGYTQRPDSLSQAAIIMAESSRIQALICYIALDAIRLVRVAGRLGWWLPHLGHFIILTGPYLTNEYSRVMQDSTLFGIRRISRMT